MGSHFLKIESIISKELNLVLSSWNIIITERI